MYNDISSSSAPASVGNLDGDQLRRVCVCTECVCVRARAIRARGAFYVVGRARTTTSTGVRGSSVRDADSGSRSRPSCGLFVPERCPSTINGIYTRIPRSLSEKRRRESRKRRRINHDRSRNKKRRRRRAAENEREVNQSSRSAGGGVGPELVYAAKKLIRRRWLVSSSLVGSRKYPHEREKRARTDALLTGRRERTEYKRSERTICEKERKKDRETELRALDCHTISGP